MGDFCHVEPQKAERHLVFLERSTADLSHCGLPLDEDACFNL